MWESFLTSDSRERPAETSGTDEVSARTLGNGEGSSGSSDSGEGSLRTLGIRERPLGSVPRQQEGVSRDFKQLGVAFRNLRQWEGSAGTRQQEGFAKALAVGGGSAPEQTRTPYLHPAILPRSQEKQTEAQ